MTLDAHLPVLIIVVPMLTAPVVTLLGGRSLPWLGATAASAFTLAAALALTGAAGARGPLEYEVGGWPAPYGIVLTIDSFSALLLLIVAGASTGGLLFGKPSLDSEVAERAPTFYAAWLMVLTGLCGIAATGDAFNLFVFLEISSLATYVLIAAGPDRRALVATYRYLILGTIGATFYLVGIGLIYMMTGTLNLADMAARVGEAAHLRPVLVAAGFVAVGLALKSAVFPLHVWMPSAYAFAPHAVSVFLAACATKAALYALVRFELTVLLPNMPYHELQFQSFLMPLAVLGFVVGSVMAIVEGDLKRMLGYSSVAQIGYILLGLSLLSVLGLTGAFVHMFNHALIKGALFMAAGCLVYRVGSGRIADLAGCARFMPFTMAAFVAAGLSMVGVPLTAGFVSKWYLVLACLERGALGYLLAALVLLASLLALVYVWKVVETAYFRPRPADAPPLREAPVAMLAPLWVLVLGNFWFGIDTDFSINTAGAAASHLLGGVP